MIKNNQKNIINLIEKIRRDNNKNWMNLLRIAIKNSPNESKRVLNRINMNDRKVTKLFTKLSKYK